MSHCYRDVRKVVGFRVEEKFELILIEFCVKCINFYVGRPLVTEDTGNQA